jgi:hypothetical protein
VSVVLPAVDPSPHSTALSARVRAVVCSFTAQQHATPRLRPDTPPPSVGRPLTAPSPSLPWRLARDHKRDELIQSATLYPLSAIGALLDESRRSTPSQPSTSRPVWTRHGSSSRAHFEDLSGSMLKPFSPVSTEKVVYAAFGFRLSARFPQVWTHLWITPESPLQNSPLAAVATGVKEAPI